MRAGNSINFIIATVLDLTKCLLPRIMLVMKRASVPWVPLTLILLPIAVLAAWFVFWTPIKIKYYTMRFVDGGVAESRAARDTLVEIGANHLNAEQRTALAESYVEEGYELLSSHDADAEAEDIIEGDESTTVSANNARSLGMFKKALELSPELDNSHLNVGFAYGTFGMYAAAFRNYRAELKLRPGNFSARFLAADAMFNLDMENEAIVFAEETASIWPGKLQAHQALIDLYKWTGKYGRVEPEYRKIISLAPDKFETRANLAEFLYSKEIADYEVAADMIESAFQLAVPSDDNSSLQRLYCFASWANAESERSGKALEYAEKAVALNGDESALKCRAVALRQLGRFAEAARDIDNLTDKDSANDQRLYLYDAMGLVENATSLAFQMAQENNTAETINNVAWFFCTAKNSRNTDAAIKLANLALTLSPGNHYYLDTYATACFVSGRVDEAIKTEEQALALAPFNKFYKKQLERFKKAKGN